MPISLSRLRIAGFKSFADPVTVEIPAGLTGIVGPNGCGKSNVVEALRWAMGETSARSLRGGEMDDVIFTGTEARASRNLAEVTLTLEAADPGLEEGREGSQLPPPFTGQIELQVCRRIERGSGSAYVINGREVRARDVQHLFADIASGAHSSAMVGQGRVAAVIAAKPVERRVLVEEAAGVTGLQARRHEAELKLRSAEANLARADDLRGQLEQQLAAMREQAAQARRYREVAESLRQAEVALLTAAYAQATTARAAASRDLEQAREAADVAQRAAASAEQRRDAARPALAARRADEAERREEHDRHRTDLDATTREAVRLDEAAAGLERLRVQTAREHAHAETGEREARAAHVALVAEDEGLDGAIPDAEREAAEAAGRAEQAKAAAAVAESAAHETRTALAEARARVDAARTELGRAEQRHRRIHEQLAEAIAERDRLARGAVDPEALANAGRAVTEADASREAITREVEEAERQRTILQRALAAAREHHAAAESQRVRLKAEIEALEKVLRSSGHSHGQAGVPLVDALAVPAGLEVALGAALGDDLGATLDPTAARHWRELPALDTPPPLPEGVSALDRLVGAPAALGRALSCVGLLDATNDGAAAQARLTPGQTLVSRAGGVWRWDGYTVCEGTPSAAAARLEQRNRLAACHGELAGVEEAAAERAVGVARAIDDERENTAREQRLRAARRDAEQRLQAARSAHVELAGRAAHAAARLDATTARLAELEREAAAATSALEQAHGAHAALPDIAALAEAGEGARLAVEETREAERTAASAAEQAARRLEQMAARRAAIARELADCAGRADRAVARCADLAGRLESLAREADDVRGQIAAFAERQAERRDLVAAAEAACRAVAAEVATAAAEADAAEVAARDTEAAASAGRERLARAESEADRAEAAYAEISERVIEQFGALDALPVAAPGMRAESVTTLRGKITRLLAEREAIGPVNLRADLDLERLVEQAGVNAREAEELGEAIAKLRGSIGQLNGEGRERIGAALERINRHFGRLFARMFGGGQAHLSFVGSDDWLEAGLEIFAQPPGKKLATLSLLSGGEQTLTALALLFAVFLCNPAPVCVLDEVDAPLDEANVERFCDLLADLGATTGTRFLVVTHHPLTMARMDRLYGVTMQERGVSRLVSVDLTAAVRLSEPMHLAAD